MAVLQTVLARRGKIGTLAVFARSILLVATLSTTAHDSKIDEGAPTTVAHETVD